eukprot:52315-Pelagomonas_calceolata.AAC.3
MLFILDIIISLTKVTVWGKPVIPRCCLIVKDVNTETISSHAANDIMGEAKEHVFRETVGRIHNRGPVCRKRTTGDRSSIYCCTLLGADFFNSRRLELRPTATFGSSMSNCSPPPNRLAAHMHGMCSCPESTHYQEAACTPPDLWACTPLVHWQQETYLTFLISNQVP